MRTKLDDDLLMERVSCPIGVLLIIFEARPEVIANIASLAIKSGNAAILKGNYPLNSSKTSLSRHTNFSTGGKESTNSFVAISNVIETALEKSNVVPKDAIQLVTTRDAIASLLAQDRYIDLVVPRGSNELVRYIKESTKIPVLGHADGLCHIYLTASADPQKAVTAIVDSKTSYPAACNSTESLLVQESALSTIFPAVAKALSDKGVELRVDGPSKAAIADLNLPKVVDVSPKDYDTEHLSLTISVKTVASTEEAIKHINTHGSGHTDCIMTSDKQEAEHFMNTVDAAGVYWNASTRLADGMRYGFGTEVGISTNKIHSRGPVGLEGLTIYKYKIRGDYQPTAQYGDGEGQKPWKHEKQSI